MLINDDLRKPLKYGVNNYFLLVVYYWKIICSNIMFFIK